MSMISIVHFFHIIFNFQKILFIYHMFYICETIFNSCIQNIYFFM